jgi:hypothetical protein
LQQDVRLRRKAWITSERHSSFVIAINREPKTPSRLPFLALKQTRLALSSLHVSDQPIVQRKTGSPFIILFFER